MLCKNMKGFVWRVEHVDDLPIEHVDDPQSQSLALKFLNISSMNKDLIDLAYGERLMKSDLICLTETQMMQRSQIEINLPRLPWFATKKMLCYVTVKTVNFETFSMRFHVL